MARTIQICVDDELNRVRNNPYVAMTEEMLLDKLEKSRESASQENYKTADSVIADIKEKYGI
ncbi:MAG: hypothetical protein ACOYBL_12865 [Lachnospiraceae bacterium]